ncbi:hypothetical protein [Streptomyces syringium]|uniref:hypothetical protein n=1 Tax=Streptomyces syringium TaxID=76729 RepID=UPI0033E0589C
MADHHRAEPVVDALDMAEALGRLEPGCLIHSDRGSEYTSGQLRNIIIELGNQQSMGRTGSCFDNAAAESFWGRPQRGEWHPLLGRSGRRPRRHLRLHRDLLQQTPPAQARPLGLPHAPQLR